MSLDFSKIFIFVVANLEFDYYYHFIQMRKMQFEKYNIPHLFLFEYKPPDYYKSNNNDYFLELDPEPFVFDPSIKTNPGFHPLMIVKFIKGLRKINLDKYDYIIRINLSTYINFPQLHNLVYSYERTNLMAGTVLSITLADWDIYKVDKHKFVSGTCIIFSSDVAKFIASYKLDDPILYKHCDDTVLGHICLPVVKYLCSKGFLYIGDNRPISDYELMNNVIIRIKYQLNQRNCNIRRWIYLLKLNDQIYYERNPIIGT